MTLADVFTALNGISDITNKVRYRAFPPDQIPNPPYVCYLETDSANFVADNKVYNAGDSVDIELYTKLRDFTLEGKIEKALNDLEVPWTRSSSYMISEKIYEIIYSITIRR